MNLIHIKLKDFAHLVKGKALGTGTRKTCRVSITKVA
jgi:hypothetical protein